MAEETTAQNEEQAAKSEVQLEGGTYEIIKGRLAKHGKELQNRLNLLNDSRKDVFGAIETKLLATERITTDNNCMAVDMGPVGNYFIFGYNVLIGLKQETKISDVFSIYEYADGSFNNVGVDLLQDPDFESDFQNLYKYYKEAHFIKFSKIGPNLFMVFKIGKSEYDVKTFKWLLTDDGIKYVDNRSDHEHIPPPQHEFEWIRCTRDMQVNGPHGHVSIDDRVFVETIGGDLTIKIEDNTESGEGIYAEDVDNKTQTLDDGEIFYAIIDNLILLKIKPYQEEAYRFIVYNEKIKKATRIDSIKDACILLPGNQGVLFSNGCYLQTGEYKLFDSGLENMTFERKEESPNGEDYMYIFFNYQLGVYALLSYNIIKQEVETPIVCGGYTFFEDGKMLYFKKDAEAKKHHAIQIWMTPFMNPNFEMPVKNDSELYKIGNKELVRGMAECNEIIGLLNKDDSYSGLYYDVMKSAGNVIDAFYWISYPDCQNLKEPLTEIKETASSALDEFEKVVNIKKNTLKEIERVAGLIQEVNSEITKSPKDEISCFVNLLAQLRATRGEAITLKDLRYIDLKKVEAFEAEVVKHTEAISNECVSFLLQEEALQPYKDKVEELKKGIEVAKKVVTVDEFEEETNKVSGELEMLIDIVGGLKIEDATETTRIIDNISAIFSHFNQINASLRKKRKELLSIEGKAEFNAKLKLVSQSVVNYIDMSDTPEKCTEFMTKLMVQLEELEGKFVDFEEFVEQISLKREEVYESFDAKKIALTEARAKRANSLAQSAERIFKAVDNKAKSLKTVAEINAYFASDLMPEKVLGIVQDLLDMGETVKADELQSKLKSIKEQTLSQLKDKTELFAGGDNLIQFGKHKFTVNTQPLELSSVMKNNQMYYHLSGTNFYEPILNEDFNNTKPVWNQSLISETKEIYRAEYLAYHIVQFALGAKDENAELDIDFETLSLLDDKELLEYIQKFMSQRYNEGYVKGVHDADCFKILQPLTEIIKDAGLLRYSPTIRAYAHYFWTKSDEKELLNNEIKAYGALIEAFPAADVSDVINLIETKLVGFVQDTNLFDPVLAKQSAEYLFHELAHDDEFDVSAKANEIATAFKIYLKSNNKEQLFNETLNKLPEDSNRRFSISKQWMTAFLMTKPIENGIPFIDEASLLTLLPSFKDTNIKLIDLNRKIDGMQGSHACISDSVYRLDFIGFNNKIENYLRNQAVLYKQFIEMKQQLLKDFTEELRLSEFKPRVLSSFVRNKLINDVYLHLIGNNLAKQIGSAGEGKRTDLMGLLLLISPPGYGKTTLMEYIANRLGIIFMKINGPAIGHEVTSVDPAEAPNATAKEELQKLNLSFEMGDNVMIYLDDIQHCNPEFLQKFISLCDGQRKIEGVYKGKTKTYDFRGRKVCVVMAGNPYTESGDKFRIPDMLANRADIYNLGDILGDTEDVFNMSYIENCLTSNAIMSKLASKSTKDIYPLIKIAESGNSDGMEFEASHSPEEVNEYTNILKKLLRIRDYISVVNQEYIHSAGQNDEYRTEPPFKLQGSYRDMNKMAEKVVPIMNDDELLTVVLSHYEGESQTLTTGAESNLLKLKELFKLMTPEEEQRWADIKATFQKNQKMKGYGKDNQMGAALEELSEMSDSINGIKNALVAVVSK